MLKYYGSEDEDKQVAETPSGSPTLSALTQDDTYFGVIRDYMQDRFGMSEDRYDRQEIVDSYINNMRSFNAGQSVTTLTEAAHLYKADDAQRLRAGEAYKLWDNTKGAFDGGTLGEKADAVWDYGRALVVDPVNLVSLGVGKLVTGGGSKVAAKLAQEAISTATQRIVAEGAEKGLSKVAIRRGVVEAERGIINNVIRGEAVEGVAAGAFNKAMRSATKKEIVGATLFDTTAAIGINAAYQSAQIYSGTQTDYDMKQAAFIGATGVTGGALVYGLSLLKRGVADDSTVLAWSAFDRAETARAAAKKLSAEEARKASKEALKKIDSKAVVASVRDNTAKAKEWLARVGAGNEAIDASGATAQSKQSNFLELFLNGKEDVGIEGVMTILRRNGVEFIADDTDNLHFSDWLTRTIKNDLPEDIRKEVSDFYDATLAKTSNLFKGKSLEEGMDTLASISSEFGRVGSVLSKARGVVANAAGDTAEEKIANGVNDLIDPVAPKVRKGISNGTMKLQQNLIRTIVTHPGTTALNVIGWVNASGMQSISDMVRGTLYGTRALGALVSGNKMTANQYSNLAKNMFSLQKQKMVNLVDGFATQQATLDILSANPKLQEKFMRYMAGGIEDDAILRELGLTMREATSVDKFIDVFQTAYGVKAVDMYTKTQEFMYAIDKQIRLKYGKSYNEFISDPDLWKAMDGKTWVEVQATAVEDALRNVYSKSYGSKDSTLGMVANVIEEVRKYPIIGAMMPFGQFFNNTIVNMADYSGVSLVHKYVAGNSRDAMELATRASVGVTLMGAFAAKEYTNMEAGLAWHEERDDMGQVRSRLYDFPFSFFKAVGRMAAHWHKEGSIPPDMFNEIVETFGPASITRQLGDTATLGYKLMLDAATAEGAEMIDVLSGVVGSSVSMYVSGFTRPLEPVNLIAGMAQGENFVDPDRNHGAKWLNNSVRYVDQVFSALGTSVQELVPEAIGGGETPGPKVNALNNRATPVPIGKLFGYRAVPSQSAIQTMFNEAGLPQWRTNLKADIPEANNRLNQIIFPFLESEAANLIDTPKWKEASPELKLQLINDNLTKSKAYALDALHGSSVGEDRRMALLYDLSKRGSGISDRDVNEAIERYGYDGDVTDLPLEQLEFIVEYIKLKKSTEKAEIRGARSF